MNVTAYDFKLLHLPIEFIRHHGYSCAEQLTSPVASSDKLCNLLIAFGRFVL